MSYILVLGLILVQQQELHIYFRSCTVSDIKFLRPVVYTQVCLILNFMCLAYSQVRSIDGKLRDINLVAAIFRCFFLVNNYCKVRFMVL